jgi:hypothetical protein
VRDIDRVWVDGDEVFVLLPETDDAAAAELAARLVAEAPTAVQSRTLSWATFPGDALTSGDLLARLRGVPAPVGLRDPGTGGLTQIPSSAGGRSLADRTGAPLASRDTAAPRAAEPGAPNEIAS